MLCSKLQATKEQSIRDGKKKLITDPLKPKTKSNIPVSIEQQPSQLISKKEKTEKVKALHDPALLNVSEQITSSQESNDSENLNR